MSLPSKTFCIAPFIQACISAKNEVRPCCTYDWANEFKLGNIDNSSLKQALQTPEWKKLRQQLLDGEQPPGCWRCFKDELDMDETASMRNRYNSMYNNIIPEANNNEFFSLRYIETGFGTLCNLACKMCGPYVSSTFHNIVKPGEKFTENFYKDMQYFDIDWNKVDYIKLIGGEPMMELKHDIFLDEIIAKNDNPEDITLYYFSNTTKKPKENIIELWKRAGKVEIEHSLDGYGDTNIYQRPGNYVWQDIEDTIDYYFSLHGEVNLTHKVNTVITPLNVMKLHELFEWRVKKFGNIDHWCNATLHPEWANISNLNDELRGKIKKYFEENESVKKYMSKYDYQRTMRKLLEPSGINLSLDDILNNTQLNLISKYYNHDRGDLYEQYT